MGERRESGQRLSLSLLLHVALPVLAGGLVYLAFRSSDLRMFEWVDALELSAAVAMLRDRVADWPMPDWLIYSAPDAAWTYSFVLIIGRLWRRAGGERVAWLAVPLALGPGAELSQLVGLVPGTFDPIDLVLTASASMLALVVAPPTSRTGRHCENPEHAG